MSRIYLGHIGLYCADLEKMREFYIRYFGGISNDRYTNPAKGFVSYCLTFGEDSPFRCQLELMKQAGVAEAYPQPALGLTHLAFRLESSAAVDALTERLRKDGYAVLGEPRMTGDGCYESVVADPEGNHIEITA